MSVFICVCLNCATTQTAGITWQLLTLSSIHDALTDFDIDVLLTRLSPHFCRIGIILNNYFFSQTKLENYLWYIKNE